MLPRCIATRPLDLAAARDQLRAAELNPLNFTMQHQEQENWCWSAVATSVGLYFRTGKWSQCAVADGVLDKSGCCTDPGPCDVPWYLDRALTYTQTLERMSAGKCSLSVLQGQIDGGQPVALRCGWNGGGGHFLAVYGYTSDGKINVADPWYGYSVHNFNTFPTYYQGGGSWTHTYFTANHRSAH